MLFNPSDPTVSKIVFSEKLARDRMMISVSYKEKPTLRVESEATEVRD